MPVCLPFRSSLVPPPAIRIFIYYEHPLTPLPPSPEPMLKLLDLDLGIWLAGVT